MASSRRWPLWASASLVLLFTVGRSWGDDPLPKPFAKHPSTITALAFNPDGKTLASASSDRSVRVWDLANGQEVLVLQGHGDTVLGVCFAPDGRSLASCGKDKTIRLWDLGTGKTVRVLRAHGATVNKLAFMPDGQTLVSASADETVRLWECASGRELRRIFGGRQAYHDLAISPDGQHVYSAGFSKAGDNWVRQWDAATTKETLRFGPSPTAPLAIALAPDGKLLATSYVPARVADRAIHLWTVTDGKETTRCDGHDLPARSLAFTPDGKFLISASGDGSIRRWNPSTGKEVDKLKPIGEQTSVEALAIAPDGHKLAYGAGTGEVFLLDVPTPRPDQLALTEKKPGDSSTSTTNDRGVVSSERPVERIEPGKDKGGMVKPGDAPRARRLLKEGDVFFVELAITRQSTHRVQGLDLATQAQYGIVTRVTVEKRDGMGNWTVRQRIEDAKLESADEVTRGLIADAIAKLPGTIHKIQLNDKLAVLDIEGIQDAPVAKGGVKLFGGQGVAMTSVLDKDGWKELLQLVFFNADQPLAPGAKWEHPVLHAWGPLGQWTGKALYQQQGKQANLHKIGYRLDLQHVAPKDRQGGLPVQLGNVKFKLKDGRGELVFDAERGRVTLAEELFRVQGSMSVDLLGQQVPFDVEEEQRFRLRVTDRDPRQR